MGDALSPEQRLVDDGTGTVASLDLPAGLPNCENLRGPARTPMA